MTNGNYQYSLVEKLSFVRYGAEDEAGERPMLVAVANFSGQPRQQVRVGVPRPGRWRELINTDADSYGGSGVGNLGTVESTDQPHQGQPHSLELTLPPLGVLWLTPEPITPADVAAAQTATPAADDDVTDEQTRDDEQSGGRTQDPTGSTI